MPWQKKRTTASVTAIAPIRTANGETITGVITDVGNAVLKPGWKTTEFWATGLGVALTDLTDMVPPNYAWLKSVLTVVAIGLYSLSRGHAKNGGEINAPSAAFPDIYDPGVAAEAEKADEKPADAPSA